MISSSEIQPKIISALIYFDVLSMPLTAPEVYRWLSLETSYEGVLAALSDLCQVGTLATDRGFYFLVGRAQLVDVRLNRYALSLPKLKRAWRFARIIAWFPWVEGIALYSSTSFFNAQETSDLDFFIITSSRRVWSSRFWINVLLKIFRLRPTSLHKANMFCVSFFVDSDHLDLGTISQGDGGMHYLYGTSQFIFLYGSTSLRERFFAANSWIARSLPQWRPYEINSKRRVTVVSRVIHVVLEYIAGFIPEDWYRQLQMYILPEYYKKIANLDTRVMISGYMIKLHHHDGRDWVAQQLKERYTSLGYETTS